MFFASLQGVLPGGSIIHRYNMKQKRDYTTEAIRLAKAIDIAVEAFTKHPPKDMTEAFIQHTIKCYLEWKENALNPKPGFKSLASLKYIITDTFAYFNEASGPDVEYFLKRKQTKSRVSGVAAKLRRFGKLGSRMKYALPDDLEQYKPP